MGRREFREWQDWPVITEQMDGLGRTGLFRVLLPLPLASLVFARLATWQPSKLAIWQPGLCL